MSKRPFAWEKSYPPTTRWDTPLRITTLRELIDEAVSKYSSRPFLEYRDKRLSYGEIGTKANAAAAAFIALGHNTDKPLALYLPNTPAHPVSFFAAAKAGIPLVSLSPLDAERELEHKLSDSGARTIVTVNFPNMLPNALKMLERGHVDHVIVADDNEWGTSSIPLLPIEESDAVHNLSKLIDNAPPLGSLPPLTPENLALLQYTGGTTGLPRAAMLSHGNLTAAVSIYDVWHQATFSAIPELELPPTNTIICALPLFHIYALTTILLRLTSNGDMMLLHLRFDPDQILHDIEVKRANFFPGVPTMWIALVGRPDFAERDLSALTFCGSGGAPIPVEIETRFATLTGLKLGGGWGMTETAPAGTNVPQYADSPPGTLGLPLPGVEMDITALDDPTNILPIGETGELRIRGPNVMKAYWKRPEETQKALTSDGFLLTGDIGYMDENGYFFIVDRKKDMIISGGFNVYPQMIEQAIYEHASVEECIVIGIPDSYRGEAAKAFIKLKDGAQPFTLDELHAFLADKIGRHEMPASLEFRDGLPRTAVGKLSKVELKQEEQRKAVKSN